MMPSRRDVVLTGMGILGGTATGAVYGNDSGADKPTAPSKRQTMTLYPIGVIEKNGQSTCVHIDAFEGSPVIDIKPYIHSIDSPRQPIQSPEWLGR